MRTKNKDLRNVIRAMGALGKRMKTLLDSKGRIGTKGEKVLAENRKKQEEAMWDAYYKAKSRAFIAKKMRGGYRNYNN